MTPRTTARPAIVRTRLPPVPALVFAAVAAVSPDERSSLAFSPSAANATGAVSRQPTTAAEKEAWKRIKPRKRLSPDQAHGSYRQVGSRPEVELLPTAGPM